MQENVTPQTTDTEKIVKILQGTVTPGNSKSIALLPDVERELAIESHIYEASNLTIDVRGMKHVAKLFFIPVIFPPNQQGTDLGQDFKGADILNRALVQAGFDKFKQGSKLIAKLFSHGEVSSWSTGDLNRVLRLILFKDEGELRSIMAHQDSIAAKGLPILTYLVGAVYAPLGDSASLDLDDEARPIAIAQNSLALQRVVDREIILPKVLRPMEYKEALIAGTVEAVQTMASFMHLTALEEAEDCDDDDLEVTALNLDVNYFSIGVASLDLASEQINVNFQLDMHRLGRTGVDRVVEAAYQSVGSIRNNCYAN